MIVSEHPCDEVKSITIGDKTNATATAVKKQSTAELKTMCPHCGSLNTQYMYGTATVYDYTKGGQSLTSHFLCKDCHKEFDVSTK